MSGALGRWADLWPRIASGAVLALVAGIEVWLGRLAFELFIAVICGAMIWELARMIAPGSRGRAAGLGLLTGGAVFAATLLPPVWVAPVLMAPALVGAGQIGVHRRLYIVFAVWIALAGHGFHVIRVGQGIDWMLWLIAVVVATDVMGYFAGKSIGGPKFWPRVSPKKTWAGIVAGWISAALVGWAALAWLDDFGPWLVALSVLASMAAQAGDFAESAIKRKMGVKDASNLIPGHGGFLDRFDGMMGAALLVLGVALILGGM